MLTFLKYVDSQLFKQLITKIIMFNNVKILILLVITLLIFWFLIVLFAILNPIGWVIVGLYKRERCICHFFLRHLVQTEEFLLNYQNSRDFLMSRYRCWPLKNVLTLRDIALFCIPCPLALTKGTLL